MRSIRAILLLGILVLSCCLREENERCEIYLEFHFDYNMEYIDAFDPQVAGVDVFVFDDAGTFLFRRHSDRSGLTDGRRMTLNGLRNGSYQILTVGGLTDKYTVGGMTLQDFTLTLKSSGDKVAEEFAHLWFGETTVVEYKADQTVWPVYLIRNTNNFHLLLHDIRGEDHAANETLPYSFKITAPETGVYGYDNLPAASGLITYLPYRESPGTEPGDLVLAKINSLRLFANKPEGYQLIVYDTTTGDAIWSYDLIPLLEKIKPDTRPDGTPLPLQEYLDRQGEWNIILIYGANAAADDAYLALYLYINNLIVWSYDIEV